MQLLGAHISSAGGLQNAALRAKKANINTIMIMPTAPIRWATKEIDEKEIINLANTIAQINQDPNYIGLKTILVHAIYLINLGRKNKQLFHLSKISLVTYLNFIYNLEKHLRQLNQGTKVLGVCFHAGSAKDLPEKEAIERVNYGINWVLEHSKGGKLLIENSAGAGNILGDRFEELVDMTKDIEYQDRLGFVIDTQHSFVSGYNWKENTNNVIEQINTIIGLKNVAAFHINDSLTPFNSHKDRHANLGEGEIGKKALKEILNHPKLRNMPFILETPAIKTEDGLINECRKLKSLSSS